MNKVLFLTEEYEKNAKTKYFKITFLLCSKIQFVTYFHIMKNLFYFASLNGFLYFGVLKVKIRGSRFLIH